MNNLFFEKPILNSPYDYPSRHWELDKDGQPTQKIIEYRRKDAKNKKSTMDTYWIPGVNNHGQFGRWAFAEFTEVYQIEADFEKKVEAEFNKMVEKAAKGKA
ncbi:MAG: hypothetical protein A2X45_16975 [Lentisphaerae bacterium GWF2_50_93]|nr:MAG: hypothetical protein A2X45_16975 [Lentisphaerae bacterium GWF2_50_93]